MGAAAAQVWPAFVLVAGLLLVGLVVEQDGLFAAAGGLLARSARSGVALFLGAAALVSVVTAILNLDTSVAFLTPVLVHTARTRREDPGPLLYATLLLSNAGSILLPGSNLTNLIVLGHAHPAGHEFLRRMGLPFVASVIVTTAVVACWHRRDLVAEAGDVAGVRRPTLGIGLAALVAAVVAMLVLRQPALPVLVVGAAAAGVRLLQRRVSTGRLLSTIAPLTLLGLFVLAVGFGVLGRAWSGPTDLLGAANGWQTAGIGALGAVLVNNLPAAALLSAYPPTHSYELLLGLGLGPNLFVTGSLAWLLWLRAARAAGAQPSVAHATRLGLVATPLALAAALGALQLTS